MGLSKEELVQKIEAARKKLNRSIENGEEYKTVYPVSYTHLGSAGRNVFEGRAVADAETEGCGSFRK